MCFHVPSFAFLTFGPAMWLTAQDQPTIGNAATIRIIPAASTTIGLKKISRIRFIFRFLSAHRLKDFPFRPPIEVHHRRNTAFITVLVVETDDCTAVFLIGASNALHACNAYNLIGRCTAERALPALRINVCFHFSVPLCSIFSRAHSIRTSRNRQFCDAALTVRQVSASRF